MIILGKVRPLLRHLAEAHPQVSIIALAGTAAAGNSQAFAGIYDATPTCCTTSAWHGARSRCRRRATGLPDPSLHRSQNGWEPIAITVGSKSSSIRSRSSHESDQTCRPSVADDHRPDGVALDTSRTGEQAEPTPTAATTHPPTAPESDRRPWSHTPARNHATTSQALPPMDLCIVVTARATRWCIRVEYCTRARFGTAWQRPTRSSSSDLTSVAICNPMWPSTCVRAQADWGTGPNGVNARGADYNPLLRKPEYPAASLQIRVQDGDVAEVPAHCATHELLRSASRRR
jgi:hypothetical protein